MVLVGLDVLVGVFGKKRFSRRQPTTAVQRTMRERGERSRAEERLDDKVATLEDLQQELATRIEQIKHDCQAENLQLEPVETPPRKSDIDAGQVLLVWLPWKRDAAGQAEPAW